ncbi:hypothetical protein EDD15DRAFT_1518112 [Pisolithus albus]|nr:hypothetical protein EDD15DRAFT_1518112 [Pisolithus albus]
MAHRAWRHGLFGCLSLNRGVCIGAEPSSLRGPEWRRQLYDPAYDSDSIPEPSHIIYPLKSLSCTTPATEPSAVEPVLAPHLPRGGDQPACYAASPLVAGGETYRAIWISTGWLLRKYLD